MKAYIYSLLFILISNTLSASSLSDSTTVVPSQPDSVTQKVVLLLLEAEYLSAKKPLDALKKYRTALITNKVKDLEWEANVRLAMGKLLYRVKSKDAIPQLLRADALYKKKLNVAGRSEALTQIAKIKEASGQFEEALKDYNVLYKLQFKGGEFVLAGNTASHLTDVFTKKKDYKEAFNYADMAKDAYYSVCRKDSLGSIYYKIASLKKILKAPKSAEYYILSQALPYYRSADDLKGRLKSFEFLGQLYKEQKRYSEAKWFYLQANNQARLASDTSGIISSLINLTVVKILIGDLVLAKQDFKEAEALTTKENAALVKNAKVKYAELFKKLSAESIAAYKKATAAPAKPVIKSSSKKLLADKPTSSALAN